MTKTVDIGELKDSIQALIALTSDGDEVVVEKNGEPVLKVVSLLEVSRLADKKRIACLGSGKGYFMSEDFDDELPDEFWGFDKEL